MKKTNILKKFLIGIVLIVPLTLGIFFPNIKDMNSNSVGKARASSVEQEAFGGRESNYIEGTGYKEQAIGASLSEPVSWTDTWTDDFANVYNMTTFTHFHNNTNQSVGDYRKNPVNASNDGTTAAKAWLISTPQELAFWARYISLAANTTNCRDSYASAPYFKLNNDINLTGKRWVPPYFLYPTTDSYTVSSVLWYNRIYFDGNGKTISNAYVKQSYSTTSGAQASYPSIFGGLTPKAQVKNLNITNAYISEGATASAASVVSQTTSNYDAVFVGIKVTNSIVRASSVSSYGVNGIASHAAVIKDCSVTNITYTIVPTTTTTTSAYARGIGQASAFINNTVEKCSLETVNQGYIAYSIGIGSLLLSTTYVNETAPASYWNYVVTNDGTFVKPDTSIEFTGGFFKNTVKNSKISVTSDREQTIVVGTSTYNNNYGQAYGIGVCTANTKFSVIGNILDNCLVSVNITNNAIASEMHAIGIIYTSFSATALTREIEITDNSVLSSTISATTQSAATVASGISYVNSEYQDAKIRRCYTENTDVISRYTKYTPSTSYTYASGINVGFATIIEDCVVGSGNIDARNEKTSIFVYGIGSTLGKSTLYGPSGVASLDRPYGRTYDSGLYGYTNLITEIKNCYNFSNITVSTTAIIYSAGIGMAEGFNKCINYGNVMGNYVGGIALGFEYAPNSIPTSANTQYTWLHGVRPLVIDSCANFGNLIKAANSNTSFIGGIFSSYWNSLNYDRKWVDVNTIDYQENLDGKYLQVTNCISEGTPYFYVIQDDYSYKLTDQFRNVAVGTLYYGAIFGRVLLNPYSFADYQGYTPNQTAFDEFTQRFVIEDNFLSNKAIIELDLWNVPEATIRRTGEISAPNTTNEMENLTEYDYLNQRPSSYYYTNILGTAYNAFAIHDSYGFNGTNGANTTSSAQIRYERVYNAVAQYWTNNLVYGDYSEVVSELNSAGWNTSTRVPQLAKANYPFQILAYDRNGAAAGYTPNVSIVKLTEGQAAGTSDISYKIGALQNPQIGMSVLQWFRYNNASEMTYATGTTPLGIRRVNGLPVIMLFADEQPTVFAMDFESKNDYDFNYTPATTMEIDQWVELEVNYTNSSSNVVSVSAVKWLAENKNTGEWEEFYAEYFPVAYDIQPFFSNTAIFTYDLKITESFIAKYALGSLGSYSFNITAMVDESSIYNIDITLPNAEGSKLSVGWDVFDESGNVNVLQDSIITLTAEYDSEIYEFGQFIINGTTDCYIIMNGNTNLPMVSIKVLGEIYSIAFELIAKKYDITIRTYTLASGNLRIELDNSGLVLTNAQDLKQAVSVDSTNVLLTVSDFYEDENAQCYYKFVGWEYLDADGYPQKINDINTHLFENFSADLIKRNFQGSGGDRTFVIVAIYQRQVKFVINMYRPGYEDAGYNNVFEIFSGSNIIGGSSQGYENIIVNENTLLRVVFKPDSRLEIKEIEGINDGFANNILYITFNTYKVINVILDARPAEIMLFTKESHESSGVFGQYAMTVLDVSVSSVHPEATSYFDIALNKIAVNSLGRNYRIIGVGIRYADSTNFYDIVFDNDGFCRIPVTDTFFKNFVGMDGTCEIWLFLAATYEVDLSAIGFEREGTTYKYSDDIGNSFTLTFTPNAEYGDANGVRMEGSNKFIIDYGTKIEYIYVQGAYSTFYDVSGISETEKTEGVFITSSRQLSFIFLLNQYNLELVKTGNGKVIINDSYGKTFELGSIITFACDVDATYAISNIKINGYSLAQLGAVQKGNTVTIKVTEFFISKVGALTNPDVVLAVNISTTVSTGFMAVLLGGGAGIILLTFIIVFLSVKARANNKKRKEAELKVREYEARLNIAKTIENLRK